MNDTTQSGLREILTQVNGVSITANGVSITIVTMDTNL